jgi:hypothetical protein
MDIAVSQGRTAQIDYLIIILFHPVKFDPYNMVLYCVGMEDLMAYNHSNDIHSHLMPPCQFQYEGYVFHFLL